MLKRYLTLAKLALATGCAGPLQRAVETPDPATAPVIVPRALDLNDLDPPAMNADVEVQELPAFGQRSSRR